MQGQGCAQLCISWAVHWQLQAAPTSKRLKRRLGWDHGGETWLPVKAISPPYMVTRTKQFWPRCPEARYCVSQPLLHLDTHNSWPRSCSLQHNVSETARQTQSYFVQPEAAPMGGNSSKLLRFSWLGGDLAETRGASLHFLLPPLHDPLSLLPSSSSAREQPRSRATCRPEAPTELLPLLRPRLTGRASGVAVRKLPKLGFWKDRFSPWWSTGLCPTLGLLLETTLGKSPQGLDRFDPEKEEEPLDAAAGEKLVSVEQVVTEVLWEKSCTRLLVAWPVLLSDPVLWLAWALELGVLAGVEGPLVRIWLVCSLKKFSRKGTKSFRSKLRDPSLSWMWFSYERSRPKINIKMLLDSFCPNNQTHLSSNHGISVQNKNQHCQSRSLKFKQPQCWSQTENQPTHKLFWHKFSDGKLVIHFGLWLENSGTVPWKHQ